MGLCLCPCVVTLPFLHALTNRPAYFLCLSELSFFFNSRAEKIMKFSRNLLPVTMAAQIPLKSNACASESSLATSGLVPFCLNSLSDPGSHLAKMLICLSLPIRILKGEGRSYSNQGISS